MGSILLSTATAALAAASGARLPVRHQEHFDPVVVTLLRDPSRDRRGTAWAIFCWAMLEQGDWLFEVLSIGSGIDKDRALPRPTLSRPGQPPLTLQ